jgi:hypothetical protein
VRAGTQARTHARTRTHARARTHARTHAHTHTHTHPSSPPPPTCNWDIPTRALLLLLLRWGPCWPCKLLCQAGCEPTPAGHNEHANNMHTCKHCGLNLPLTPATHLHQLPNCAGTVVIVSCMCGVTGGAIVALHAPACHAQQPLPNRPHTWLTHEKLKRTSLWRAERGPITTVAQNLLQNLSLWPWAVTLVGNATLVVEDVSTCKSRVYSRV